MRYLFSYLPLHPQIPRRSPLFKVSKYPPAKPGPLGCEPLKAAAGSLTRPRKTTGDNEVLTCRGPLLNLPAHFPCYKLWEFVTFLEAQRPHAASPGAILCEKAHHCEFPANTAVTVKLLLPPRQSRGVSQRTRVISARLRGHLRVSYVMLT